MATTDVSPLYVGDTNVVWHNVFTESDGSVFSLAGLDPATAFSMHWKNTQNGVVRVGNGIWTFPAVQGAAALGLIDYNLGSVDVGLEGIHKAYPIVTISGRPQHFDYQIIEILQLA